MDEPRLAQTVANLHAWFDTVRQPEGYAGPVAHWWRDCSLYTGPGLDWRYEGILVGYRRLYEKTGRTEFRDRLRAAAADVIGGQRTDGSYRASQFEQNPGVLGTPHEAAATLGLLRALPHAEDMAACIHAAGRNLVHLVTRLWDPVARGFDDRPGVPGRVPNKLATLAEALLAYAEVRGDERCLAFARAALDDVLRYQVRQGQLAGAVHQYAPGGGRGDGRFFPYYNARCVPPLLAGARQLDDPAYRDAAFEILDFLRLSMNGDGSWPQIVYEDGQRVPGPRWIAGSADILYAFHVLGVPIPEAALDRLLGGQLSSGGLRTAAGFRDRLARRARRGAPDYRDLLPVAGWNDKALRLLAELLPADVRLPRPVVGPVGLACTAGGGPARFYETEDEVRVTGVRGTVLYRWVKAEPWAAEMLPQVAAR